MSEIRTLGTMLRNYAIDEALPGKLAPALTEDMLRHSELHASFGSQAELLPVPTFLRTENRSASTDRKGQLAAEAAAFLQKHAGTRIHDGFTAECIGEGEEPVIRFPREEFRGPFGYDLASLLVSCLLGWCRGNAQIEDDFERDDFCDACLDLMANLVDQLIWNYDELFADLADAPEAQADDFKRIWFEGMMRNLAAAAGLEILRVLEGERTSEGLGEITDPDKKKEAEAILLYAAEACIRERDSFFFGADFAAVIERAGRTVKKVEN